MTESSSTAVDIEISKLPGNIGAEQWKWQVDPLIAGGSRSTVGHGYGREYRCGKRIRIGVDGRSVEVSRGDITAFTTRVA